MTKSKSRGKKFSFKGFVNLEFTVDQRTNILAWMENFGEEPVDALVVLVEAMWKFSLGWDTYHGAYQLSITCHDDTSSYFGRCFTLKHVDPGRGILVLRYIYDSQLKTELYRLDEPVGDHDW